jgi:hypothetical protein
MRDTNATDNNILNETEEAYLEAIEKENKQNAEMELLLEKVDESWLIEDEIGRISWTINEEERKNIDSDVLCFLNQSIEEKNELINENIIVQTNDEIKLSDEASEDYYIQSGLFSVKGRYKKVWGIKIWIGFDLIANNPGIAIAIATAGVLAGLIDYLTDISILWKSPERAVALAKIYCHSLVQVVKQLSNVLNMVPKYILTCVEQTWKGLLVGSKGSLGWALALIKLVFPSVLDGIKIINNAAKGRGTTFHYTTVVFKGYTLH